MTAGPAPVAGEGVPPGKPGAIIALGRTAQVLEWADGLVLKRYLPGTDPGVVDAEERESRLAAAMWLTPVRCHGRVELAAPDSSDGADGADGGEPGVGLVFDRVDGVALTTLAERDPRRIPEVGRILAREHARLHAVQVPEGGADGLLDVRELAVAQLDTPALAGVGPADREVLAAALRALSGGRSVLHLDVHPLNVFTHRGGYALIDWQSTAVGDPAADVAMTRLLFTEAELFPGLSLARRALYQSVRRVMLHFYAAERRRLGGPSPAEVARWATCARVLRLGLLDVPSERAALTAKLTAASRQAQQAGRARA